MPEMESTRRGFLSAAAVAGLSVPWIGSASAAVRPADPGLKLGVASYSLRKLKRADAIAAVKALRTPYVNIKSFHLPYDLSPDEIAAGRREFDEAGLKVVGSGNNSMRKEQDIEKVFSYAKAARFTLLVIAPHPDLLPKVEAAVKKSGIPVAIHNHGPEDKFFAAPSDAYRRIRDLDPRVGVCVDVGHTARTGKDVVQEIADGGARVLDMHMKDLKDFKNKRSQCIVGEGAMPVPAIFRQLLKMKYSGYVNLEYEIDANDPLPGMQRSFAYMRGVLAGMEAGG